jgi:hypothetical protein
MQIEGLCIAIITAKHSPAVQVIALPHAWVPWMLRGACGSPSCCLGPEENIDLSVRLGKKFRLEESRQTNVLRLQLFTQLSQKHYASLCVHALHLYRCMSHQMNFVHIRYLSRMTRLVKTSSNGVQRNQNLRGLCHSLSSHTNEHP